MNGAKPYEQLLAENENLRWQLYEATETIQAIRTGQIDALVVQGTEGHELYTLKTADHTYRIFIETMNEGAVTLNREGFILYSNSAFATMVELPLTKVFGLRFREFVSPDMQSAFDLLFNESWLGNKKEELSIKSINHTIVPCLLSVTPMQLDGGDCLSLILTDLTAQKETQKLLKIKNEELAQTNTALEISNQALNRSNSNLQQFAYVASHDLQEPLRKVQQFGDLLKNRYAGQLGDGVNYLERMQSAASRMSTLIRDLLSFSRISTQQDTIAPVSLSAVFKNVLTDLDLRIQETNAMITLSPLPDIQGDQSQLEQLFQNLVSNALKFRRPGERPVIHVSSKLLPTEDLPAFVKPTRQTAAYHRIDVSDNGIGFDEKYIDRIFQVFQRLHGKNEYVGTGIGLAICEKVVANHGGAISASSQPGQGATFSVYLPKP
ncbi:sensor histidine kinase [Spirosoma linguale]|uniref:histidine kinase n=1 Tax=Spirosoma linguale (strain ATCC 33905 / DSM 74 / LMG 10896 / Claus 1) TaxID=504472 RepID=D2QBP7_SPILD|nr:PAS/PAC sensor signal transduction histidine kinase [Spirosoma linguale DSM 74]